MTGKGGGAGGGYVSNESLIQYALIDARNRAAALGATVLVYSGPTMGGNQGTTTSAMVTGEAFRCDGRESPTESAPSAAPPPPATTIGPGCQFDAQCKGDRVCVRGECVAPSAATPPAAAASTAASTGAAR